MHQFLDIFLHLDKHLDVFVRDHGVWVYGLLFLIVFCETGLVVTPFLPGDSLLFAAGAISARVTEGHPGINIWALLAVLLAAAMLGDNLNYWIGRTIGPKIFRGESTSLIGRLLSRKHLDRSQKFFDKHGGKSVILGHFVPIVRTFVPFVAGASKLPYSRFLTYNLTGVAAWVGICVFAGYFFGNIPVIQRNFELAVLGVIVVSLIPLAVEFIKSRRETAPEAAS